MLLSINGINPLRPSIHPRSSGRVLWLLGAKRLLNSQKDPILVIKDAEYLEEFNRQELKKEKLDYPSALRIFEGMWKEAVSLGALPPKEPLEGIGTDIRIAEILNHV